MSRRKRGSTKEFAINSSNDGPVVEGSPMTREEREKLAIEKAADLFKRIYGPAIKELETK